MSIEAVLLVMTDGRPGLIEQTLDSAAVQLVGVEWSRVVIHDDSADQGVRARLRSLDVNGKAVEVVGAPSRLGFGGAIRHAWRYLNSTVEADVARFVFHLEDDFTFDRKVSVEAMAHVLNGVPSMVQMALRRQPWNDAERAAGGVVEQHPEDYTERVAGGIAWLEHRRYFTTNPCLYRRSLCGQEWPRGAHSEGVFSAQLFEDPAKHCALWGRRESGTWVTHIGAERVGKGY